MQWASITIVLFTTFGLAMNLDELNMSVSPPINLESNLRRALLKALTELENEDSKKSGNNEIDKNIEHASVSSLSTTVTTELNKTKIPSILVQKSPSVQHSSITTIEKEELNPFNDAEKILTSFTLPNRNASLESNQHMGDRGDPNYLIIKRKKLTLNINNVETTTVFYSTSTEENEAKVEDVQFFSAPLVAAFTVHQDAQGVPKKVEPIYKANLNTGQEKVKLLPDNKPGKYDIKEQETRQQKIDNQSSTFRQYSQSINNPLLNHITSTKKPIENHFHSNAVVSSSSLFENQQLPNKPPQQFNEVIDKSKNVVSLFPINIYHSLTAGQLPLNGQILPVKGPINFHTPIIQSSGFRQFHSIPQINPSLNFNQRHNNQAEFDSIGHQRDRFLWKGTIADSHINNNLNEMPSSFSIQKSIQSPSSTNLSEKKLLTDNFNSVLDPPGKGTRFFRSNLEANFVQPQNNRILRSNLNSIYRSNHYDPSQVNHNRFNNALINSGAFEVKSLEDINIISKVLSLDYLDGIQFGSSQRNEQWAPVSNL